jgi:DNA repair exonuclease SbcCD ATPase subunit
MIQIKNLTVKNFMSVGNSTQGIDFDRKDLTLVLGENLDLGGDGSRNGTGKTTIINALSYALYGQALSNIRKDNLVNKTNNKNMLVSLDFNVGGKDYRIERGRKPNLLKFYVNNKEQEITDDAQGALESEQFVGGAPVPAPAAVAGDWEPLSVEAFDQLLRTDAERMSRVVKASGARID